MNAKQREQRERRVNMGAFGVKAALMTDDVLAQALAWYSRFKSSAVASGWEPMTCGDACNILEGEKEKRRQENEEQV